MLNIILHVTPENPAAAAPVLDNILLRLTIL